MAPDRSDHSDDDRLVTGRRPVLELLRAGGPIERILLAGGAAPSGAIGEIRKRAEASSVPVKVVPKQEVDRIARGLNHQGVAAVTARFRYTDLKRMLAAPAPALVFLDGVMDPHNLGSVIRTADQAGFDGVVVRSNRAAGVTATVRRVAAGAAEVMAIARVSSLASALDTAKDAGLWVAGLDSGGDTDIWSSPLLERPVALVLGSEDRGISPSVRARCDGIVMIPRAGHLGSLNVGVAAGIAMFEVVRRRAVSDKVSGRPLIGDADV